MPLRGNKKTEPWKLRCIVLTGEVSEAPVRCAPGINERRNEAKPSVAFLSRSSASADKTDSEAPVRCAPGINE
jgi:hypothetical protein